MKQSPYSGIPESAGDWQVTKERRRRGVTSLEPALHMKGPDGLPGIGFLVVAMGV